MFDFTLKSIPLEKLDIGTTLRKHRNKYKYSQQYVANFFDISRNTYRKWENNQVDFSISQLSKIAEFCGIEIHKVIIISYIK